MTEEQIKTSTLKLYYSYPANSGVSKQELLASFVPS